MRQAEPVHAGVDMNGGAAGPAGAAAKHVPFGEFVEIADHGPGVDLGVGVAAILEEAVEHIDRRRRQSGARGARFIQRGDEKRLAAGARQRAGDRLGAAAIGVRLDHAGAFGRHRGLLELAPVGDDGVEIDGEHAGGSRQRGRLVRFRREQVAGRDRIRVGDDVHAALYAPAARRFNRAGPQSVGVRRQMAVLREVAEPGELALELQFDGAGRAVALLADDDFGLAVHQRHVELPFFVFRRADARLLVGEVIFLAVHEHHDVGVLLDRTGFTQVGQLRALVVAAFDLTR